MSPVEVVVIATAPDIQAEAIARAVAQRPDMTLIAGRVLTVSESDALQESKPPADRCGVILVGADSDTEEPAERYLAVFSNCVVMRVTAPIGDVVRVAAHHIGLQDLLGELRTLVDQSGSGPQAQAVQLRDDLAAQEPR